MRKVNLILLAGLFVWTLTACGGGGGGTGGGGPIVSDTTPPVISRVAVEPSTLLQTAATVQVEAEVRDDASGVEWVKVEVIYPDGTRAEQPLAGGGGSTYTARFEARWSGTQPGKVRFTVSARDRAGNTQTASAVEVRAAALPPGSPW